MQSSKLNRRSFLHLAGGIAAGAWLTACAPVASPSGEGAAPAAERASLVFWAPQHFIVEQNEYYTESVKLAAAAGDFDVDVQMFPWGDYNQKQNAAIEAGTLPDVLLGVAMARFHALGLLVDVSDIFAEIGESGGGWYQPDIDGSTIGGKQWVVPFHNEPQFLYYRGDLLGEAGITPPVDSLDSFIAAAQAVTNPDKRIWGFGNTYSMAPDGNNFTMMLVFAFGGMLQDEEGNVAINSQETLDALKFSSAMLNEYNIMPAGVTGWDDTGNNKAFLSGQLAMCYNSGSILNNMRESDPGWLQSTVVGPLPPGPAGKPLTFIGGSDAGVMASSKYPDQAKQLIKGTMAPERYPGNLESANGMFFPTLQNYTDLAVFTEDPWNKMTVEMLPYAILSHEPGDPSPWLDEVNAKFLFAELVGRVAVDGMDPAEALADFERQALEIKDKYESA